MRSFHFDMGNSTVGPVGLCARINADTPQEATARLRELLDHHTDLHNSVQVWRDGEEYISVYVNTEYPSPSHIDDDEALHTESQSSAMGKTVEKGSRKARVDNNRVSDERPFAVFMHTYYSGHWYYDGYRTAATVADAVKLREEWLNA